MGWRIVLQPNGKLARFSEIVDNFTDMNMTRPEAIACCAEYGLYGIRAEEKVGRGIVEGISRWHHALRIIKYVHGKKEVDRILAEINGASDEPLP